MLVLAWFSLRAKNDYEKVDWKEIFMNNENEKELKQYSEIPPLQIDPKKKYNATVKMENGEDFVISLFPDKAPITVNSFVFLSREGFFDGVTFHRVLDGFMAQGGDPTGTGRGGPGYHFENEDSEYYDQIIRQTLEVVLNRKSKVGPFDAILIDEGQDFDKKMLEILLNLLRPEGDFIVCLDSHQDLYKRRRSWKSGPIQGCRGA